MAEDKKGLNIELTEEVAEGIYSNLAIINHSPQNLLSILLRLCLVCLRQKLNQELF